MTEELIIKLGQDALKTTALLATPLLLSTLVIGLLVSVFQAVTQINEATLTFVPKMIIIALILVFAGPLMIDVMSSYTINLLERISTMVTE